MKTFSPAYRSAMDEVIRNKSEVEITFKNYRTTESRLANIKSDHAFIFSAYMSNTTKLVEPEYTYPPSRITMELNRWMLDGTMTCVDNVNNGWIKSSLTDGAGAAVEVYDDIIIELPSPVSFPSVTIEFERSQNVYPRHMNLILIDVNGSRRGFYNIGIRDSRFIYDIDNGATDIVKMMFVFLDGLPMVRFRVEHIFLGRTEVFGNDRFTEVVQTHDVDPISRRLPQESMRFTLLDYEHNYDPENPDSVYNFVDENGEIEVRYGIHTESGVEWLAPDKYILSDKPTVDNNRATFGATSIISRLKGTYTKDYYSLTPKSLYDMAVNVLEDAGIVRYEVDEALKDIKTTAILPKTTHAQALQIIAHAAHAAFYTDADHVLHIKQFSLPSLPTASMMVNHASTIERGESLSKTDTLRDVKVTIYSYEPLMWEDAESDTDYYTRIIFTRSRINESSIAVEFDKPYFNYTIRVSSGNWFLGERIEDFSYRAGAWGIEIFNLPRNRNLTISIIATEIIVSESVYTYSVNPDGEDDEENNALIDSTESAIAFAEKTAQYLSLRDTYDIDYRGNPEIETRDVIDIETDYAESIRTLVLTDEIRFDGSLHGKLKVKKL